MASPDRDGQRQAGGHPFHKPRLGVFLVPRPELKGDI
jgi:hypothetical protein